MGLEKLGPRERTIFLTAGIALGVWILIVLARGTAGAATAMVLAVLYISMCRKYSELHSARRSKARASLAIHVIAIAVVTISALPL